jgi:hypothetical protein
VVLGRRTFPYERGTPVPSRGGVSFLSDDRLIDRSDNPREARFLDELWSWTEINAVQGYLAHKKQPPPMTLQYAYASGPTVVLARGGGCFLVSRVALYHTFSSGPLGPLGFEGAQHRQTLRPSVDGIRSKALRPFGLQ